MIAPPLSMRVFVARDAVRVDDRRALLTSAVVGEPCRTAWLVRPSLTLTFAVAAGGVGCGMSRGSINRLRAAQVSCPESSRSQPLGDN